MESDFFKLNGEFILLRDTVSQENENGILLFGHPTLMSQLKTVNRLAADATFSVCPPLFSQVWILHALSKFVSFIKLLLISN